MIKSNRQTNSNQQGKKAGDQSMSFYQPPAYQPSISEFKIEIYTTDISSSLARKNGN